MRETGQLHLDNSSHLLRQIPLHLLPPQFHPFHPLTIWPDVSCLQPPSPTSRLGNIDLSSEVDRLKPMEGELADWNLIKKQLDQDLKRAKGENGEQKKEIERLKTIYPSERGSPRPPAGLSKWSIFSETSSLSQTSLTSLLSMRKSQSDLSARRAGVWLE